MTTITKERIELFIKNPLDNGLTRGEQMEVARIALASLAAEPVAVNDDMAYAFHHALSDSSLGADEVEEIKAGLRAAFANVTIQPEPVVPDEIEPDDSNTFDYVDGWNACRAAMLYGAVPASQAYKLPQTQFKQVADLYEMQFDDGRTCAFHTDAQKAVQWLQACDGNRVQEYIKLERLQNALSGNSPVTPDGWISCSDRMPEDTKMLLAFSQGEIVAAYWNWVVNPIDYKKYRAFTYLSGNILDDVTHWMPLTEPPL
ncbi:DUF551 domain-containing protein [Escherichia coli]|nr:DUF551 domain-containing protein [Escherichia coli]EJW6882827.1 DUF551 domain-containing protein [Escherichia coli]ELG5993847.1 DUF551 domain-containing protein [Escherichia coli]ELI2503570.1 DUF551 domain-containing protein [Escherichia coli]ELR5464028.1 DUF551 domain-containing protein [Escherichia coli]